MPSRQSILLFLEFLLVPADQVPLFKRRVYPMHLFDQGVRKVGAIKLWMDLYEDCGLIEKIRHKSSQHFRTPQKIDQVRKEVNKKPRLSQRRGRLGQNERRVK